MTVPTTDTAGSLERSLLAVLGSDGQPVGAAFLIAPDLAMTCAHVVEDAARNAGEGSTVELTVPLTGHGERITAVVQRWQPIQPDGRGDVAVLRLPALPPGGAPTTLVEANEVHGHPMLSFGFPDKRNHGVWHEGRLLRRQAGGWIQVQPADPTGYRIEEGFSGAPAWDSELGGVVGMVVTLDRKNAAGYVIPVETLLDTWPELRARVPHWRSYRQEPRVAPVPAGRSPSWRYRAELDEPVTVVPPHTARSVPLLVFAGVWLALWLALLVDTVVGDWRDGSTLATTIVVLVAFGALALPRPMRAELHIPFVVIVAAINLLVTIGLVVFLLFAPVVTASTVAAVAALLGMQVWALLINVWASRWWARRELDRALPDEQQLAARVFGNPGEAFALEPSPEAEREAQHRRYAQHATAAVVQELLHIPAVRLLHAPPSPDHGPRRVDHAVIAGRRVALVYGMLWPPGHYTLAQPGEPAAICRNGTDFPVVFPNDHLRFIEQVTAWRERLPDAEVLAAVIVHASPPGPVTFDLPDYSAAVLMAEEAVEVIGEWLLEEGAVLDRLVLAALLDPTTWP